MTLESPQELLARLKIGREEFCQRLLTMLVLNAPYPKWNSRSAPSPDGLAFLKELHRRSFGEPWPGDGPVFVDEFELPPVNDDEAGGAPDYAVVWEDHLWLIELKTEKASHRKGQVRGYFGLAHHHYPGVPVDLLYVTPPMKAAYEPSDAGSRYAHTTWQELLPLITSTWSSVPDRDRQLLMHGLVDAVDSLGVSPAGWRLRVPALPSPIAPLEPVAAERGEALLERAMEAARQTAGDGQQRAVEFLAGDLQELLDLRAEVRARLASAAADSALRRVMPWIWRWQSKGAPLTEGGAEVGMELRLSRYARQLY